MRQELHDRDYTLTFDFKWTISTYIPFQVLIADNGTKMKSLWSYSLFTRSEIGHTSPTPFSSIDIGLIDATNCCNNGHLLHISFC